MTGEHLGCGARNCIIEPTGGVTHGGACRCLHGMRPDAMVRLRKAIARDREHLADLGRRIDTLVKWAR